MDFLLSIPILVFTPMLISFLLISPFFTNNEITVRRFSKGMFSLIFAYVVLMLIFFDKTNPYINEIHFWGMNWVQSIGIKFIFKLTPISMILTVLTSFIFLLASISSKLNIRKNHKFYYSMLFLLMSSILGIFTSADMFVFFLFWELELIPAYFLIGGNWLPNDNSQAKASAIKFIIFTFAGSMFMLLGILLLQYYSFVANGFMTSDFSEVNIYSIPMSIQIFISICLIIGFGVKLPIIPLHTWLPDAHTDAPTPVSMILAGILLKTGAYGLFVFNYELLPQAFKIISAPLAILALINIIYSAFVAYAQTDIKRIVAYSSISNMGLILLGLCAINKIALSASVFHMAAHGIVTCGLFMLVGIVYLRCKTRDINKLSGIAVQMPRLFGFATIIVLASIGIPLFAPFIGEILTILGALNSEFSFILKLCAVLSLPLLILSSCYMLKFLHNSFFGTKSILYEKVNDISVHEFVVLGLIIASLIVFGIFPNTILSLI